MGRKKLSARAGTASRARKTTPKNAPAAPRKKNNSRPARPARPARSARPAKPAKPARPARPAKTPSGGRQATLWAAKLRRRREELGLTLDELARRTNMSIQTLCNYENGWVGQGRPALLFELTRALATSLDWLLGPDDRPAPACNWAADGGVGGELVSGPTSALTLSAEVPAGVPFAADDFGEARRETVCGSFDPSTHYLLQVRGDSMERELRAGDWIVVRHVGYRLGPTELDRPSKAAYRELLPYNNHIVAVHLNGEPTLKWLRLRRLAGGDFEVILEPENRGLSPRRVEKDDDLLLSGVVVQLARRVLE